MEQVKKCLLLNDEKEVFACVKEAVKSSMEGCTPRIVLLTRKDSEASQAERLAHKSELDSGIIQEVDMSSAEGMEITGANSIDGAPALILLDCHNKMIEAEE